MYVSATIVETYDVIINFYVINICSWDPSQSETLEGGYLIILEESN